MRTEKVLGDFGFIKVKSVIDPENHCRGYQYAERKGVDSVAFVCIDRNKKSKLRFLVNREFTPPNGKFMYRAFGGSMDKNKNETDIVIDEVLEEVGYKVDGTRVYYMGKCFVSTQMNQTCYLYMVDITDLVSVGREPENKIEAMAEPTWVSVTDILNGDDWKSIAILCKGKLFQQEELYHEKTTIKL